MKKFFLLLALTLVTNQVSAFEIVYPAKNNVTINAKSTFFIGSSDKPLKINGQNVPLHTSGGFAYVVNLNNGTNTFTLESEEEKKVFVITKTIVKSTCLPQNVFNHYKEKKSVYVTTENSPLRSTPINAGINRMAHLQRNIQLLVDGEKNGFYRVILGENNYGWISKDNVKDFENFEVLPAELKGYDYIDDENYFTFIFHLDKKVPFEIVEGDTMFLKLYNVKDQKDNIYTMDFPYKEASFKGDLIGYSGEYDGNDFVWKIRKPPAINYKRPLKNLKIAIDAGHGGFETGATGCLGDKEKDVNLSVSRKLAAELRKRGAKVVMTRNDDVYVGLKDRVDIANREEAVILLSIHANALPDGVDPNKYSGTSIYYYYNQAKPLADTIMKSVTATAGVNDDKVRQASLALVRNTNALSLLIEIAYLINPSDNVVLINPDFQEIYVKAIADGIESFMKK